MLSFGDVITFFFLMLGWTGSWLQPISSFFCWYQLYPMATMDVWVVTVQLLPWSSTLQSSGYLIVTPDILSKMKLNKWKFEILYLVRRTIYLYVHILYIYYIYMYYIFQCFPTFRAISFFLCRFPIPLGNLKNPFRCPWCIQAWPPGKW